MSAVTGDAPTLLDAYREVVTSSEGVDELVAGQRIEFDFAAGRRGPQALRVRVLDEPRRRPVHRRKPEELGSMLADVMTLIETQVQPALTNGRYPDRKASEQIAKVLREIARELDS